MSVTELARHEAAQPVPVLDAGTPGWEVMAACAASTSEVTRLFFSDDLADIAVAKSLCAGCPVLTDCLETAGGGNSGAQRGDGIAHCAGRGGAGGRKLS